MCEVDPGFIALAKRMGISDPIICDIGSRDGSEGIHLLKQLEARELHIFEPNPLAASQCKNNLMKLGHEFKNRVFCNEIALSDRSGQCTFFPVDVEESENKDIGFSSFYRINPRYTKRRKRIVQQEIFVNTITLDSYFADRQSPDILWIDVEGAELLVLKGATSVLKRVKLIHVEVSFRAMHIGKPLFWSVDSYLQECGLRFVRFVEASYIKTFLYRHRLLPNPPWRLNAVYCNKVA